MQLEIPDQVSAKVPPRRVKLKSRNLLDSDIDNRKSYMEHILEAYLPEQVSSVNYITRPPVIIKPTASSESTPETDEIAVDTIIDSTKIRETYPKESSTRKEDSRGCPNELENHETRSVDMLESTPDKQTVTMPDIITEIFDGYLSDVPEKETAILVEDQNRLVTEGEFSTECALHGDMSDGFSLDGAEKSPTVLQEVDPETSVASAELSLERVYGEVGLEDIDSDLENYMDAVNTTESDADTDPESTAKSDLAFSNMGAHRSDYDIHEQEEQLTAQPSELDSVGKLVAPKEWNSMPEHPAGSIISDDVTDVEQPLEHVHGSCVPFEEDNLLKERPKETQLGIQPNGEVRECVLTVHLLANGPCNSMVSDVTCIESEVGEASSGFCIMDLPPAHPDVCPYGSGETQLVSSLSDDRIGYVERTHVDSQHLNLSMEDLPGFVDDFDISFSEAVPLAERGDSSLERNDASEGIDPAGCVQGQIPEIVGDTLVMPDHLSESKNESDLKQIPAEYMGDSTLNLATNLKEQVKFVKEAETCIDGSVPANIPESSPGIFAATEHPEILSAQTSTNVKISDAAVRELDITLPLMEDLGFVEPTVKSINFYDDLLPLSDNSVKVYSIEDVEAVLSEDLTIQGMTIPEGGASVHVEHPPVSIMELGDLQDPIEHSNNICSLEDMPSLDPASYVNNGSGEGTLANLPPMSTVEVGNIVKSVGDTSVEGLEKREPLLSNVVPPELEHFFDAQLPRDSSEGNLTELSTITYGMDIHVMQPQLNSTAEAAGERIILMPVTKPLELEHSSEAEKPEESFDADITEHLPMDASNAISSADVQLQNNEPDLIADSDAEKTNKLYNAASNEHLPLESVNEMLLYDLQLLNKEHLMVASDVNNKINYPAVGSADKFPPDSINKGLIDDVQLQDKELCPSVADTAGWPSEPEDSDLNKGSVQLEKHTECTKLDDSIDDYVIVEADGSIQNVCSVYSVNASGLDVQLQENYLPRDAVLDLNDVEVKELSHANTLTVPSRDGSCSAIGSSSASPLVHGANPTDAISVCLSCAASSAPSMDGENLVHLESGHSGQEEGNSSSLQLLDDDVAKPLQDSEHLDCLDAQFENTCAEVINPTPAISLDIGDQPSKPEPHVITSSGENDELHMSLSKLEVYCKVEDGVSVTSTCSSEVSVSSAMPSVSYVGLASTASSKEDVSESILQETPVASPMEDVSETVPQDFTAARSNQEFSETCLQEPTIVSTSQAVSENDLQKTTSTCSFQSQDVVETPPPPPLPPIEWRLGKLRLGSLTSNGNTAQLSIMTNSFMDQITGAVKCQQYPLTTVVEMVQSENSLASLPVLENERFHQGSLISEGEKPQPPRLSELPPIVDEKRQMEPVILDSRTTDTSNACPVASPTEDGKSGGHGALVPELEVGKTQLPQLSQGEGRHEQHSRSQLGLLAPSLELERSQLEASIIARDPIPPPNAFFVRLSPEEWKHQYGHGIYSDSVQHLNFSDSIAGRGPNMPPYGFLYSLGQNPSTIYDFMMPTMEAEKPKWYHSIRDRPRNPLIEAVAAHDRNTVIIAWTGRVSRLQFFLFFLVYFILLNHSSVNAFAVEKGIRA